MQGQQHDVPPRRIVDVTDLDQQVSTLRITGKYGKTRLLPLHPSVSDGLTAYLGQRNRLLASATSPALFVTLRGTRLLPQLVHPVFRTLTDQVGLTPTSTVCRPRLHNLRHSFAVASMLDAYRPGTDPAAVLPVLATWLGHADPGDTYWYLTGTAELLAATTNRLQAPTGQPVVGDDLS